MIARARAGEGGYFRGSPSKMRKIAVAVTSSLSPAKASASTKAKLRVSFLTVVRPPTHSPGAAVADEPAVQRNGGAGPLRARDHGVAEDGVEKAQHCAAMQDAIGVAVPLVGLEAEFELARGILTPVIRAVVPDEAVRHPERLKPRRG